MPKYRIRYTQPVHATYEADVQADDVLDAIRKLLALYGTDATPKEQAAVSADIDCNGDSSEIIWDATEPVRFEYLTEIKELHGDDDE